MNGDKCPWPSDPMGQWSPPQPAETPSPDDGTEHAEVRGMITRYTLSFEIETSADPSDLLDALCDVAEQMAADHADRPKKALDRIADTCTVQESGEGVEAEMVCVALDLDTIAARFQKRGAQAANLTASHRFSSHELEERRCDGLELGYRKSALTILRALDIPTPAGVPVAKCVDVWRKNGGGQ